MLEGRETSVKIDEARELYRPVATRASLLYFILNDLHKINPIYQFSLKVRLHKTNPLSRCLPVFAHLAYRRMSVMLSCFSVNNSYSYLPSGFASVSVT